MITITYAEKPGRSKRIPGIVVVGWWILLILFGIHAGFSFGQTDYIPSTATAMRFEWQDGGHAPGDIIQYDLKVQIGGLNYFEYAIPTTFKDYKRGFMPDSGTAFVQAWSVLTGKSSAWSAGKTYHWLRAGQIPEEPVSGDTIIEAPVAGWPVVYDAYNMSLIWTCDKNWYSTADKCLMIPSSINPTFPAYAEVTIEFPTDSEYAFRVEGYDNGVKVLVDGVDLFTVKFAERGFSSGIGRKWLTKGFHKVRIYGWRDGAMNIGRVRETRIYRASDYADPGSPVAVKGKGI